MRMGKGRDRRAVALILLVLAAVALRAAYGFFPLSAFDGGIYLANAKGILAGTYFFPARSSAEVLYRTPGYPIFLAALLGATGSPQSIAWAQHGLGLLTAFLIYALALRVFKRTSTAVLAAAFAGLHGHLVYLESYALSETLSIFLLYALLYLGLGLVVKPERADADWLGVGVVGAAAGLCRPELFAAGGLIAGGLLVRARTGARMRKTGLFLLPILLASGGWLLRNEVVGGYAGMTPNAEAAFFDGPAGGLIDWSKVRDDDMIKGALFHLDDSNPEFTSQCGACANKIFTRLAPYQVDYGWASKAVGRLAWRAVRENPGAFLRASAGNLVRFARIRAEWPPRDMTEAIPPLSAGGAVDRLSRWENRLEALFLLPLALCGMLISMATPRFRKDGLFLVLPLVFLALSYAALTYGGERYRLILEPGLGLFAAFALGEAAALLPFNRARTVEAAAPIAMPPLGMRLIGWTGALAAICFYAGLGLAYRRIPTRVPCAEEKRLSRASACFDRALAENPNDPDAWKGRAGVRFRMADLPGALSDFARARALTRGDRELEFNSAMALHIAGDKAGAAARLASFMRGLPREDPMRNVALKISRQWSSVPGTDHKN